MTTLIYILQVDNLAAGVRTALDIYSTTGMEPKIISDGINSVKFNRKDAYLVITEDMDELIYIDKNRIE
jgi:hypothetical protein